MINLFDLSAGITGTKTITAERVLHRDGSPARPDAMKKILDPVGAHIEDKQVTHEPGRSFPRKKPAAGTGTPMKKLIEQEMSKEMEAHKNPPSIVAKLMGLDALPAKERIVAPEGRTHSVSGAIRDGNNRPDRRACGTVRSLRSRSQSSERREYRDVYEVPPRMTHCIKDEYSPHRRISPGERRRADMHERFISPSEKRMDLVREKFTEAKRLATNHKLLHSKEFQDAIEVLSSNRDLFLKFLEEPNSLFSEYVQELQRAHLPSQTRRITVLKPSNTPPDTAVDEKPKGYLPVHGEDSQERSISGCVHPKDKPLPQPTRIVVLKPSPAKPLNGKMPVSEEESLGELLQAHRNTHSRHAEGKEMMPCHPQDNNYCYRRDETLLSSVLSNGYTGDESSFNRSDCEYPEDDEFDNSSDSDIPSRLSWDCNHNNNNSRLDNSPCSLSSFSRMSYSPESSVIREAKKRLSERWVMVTSNELSNNNDQKQVRRSVSTLGEMLAIRGANREAVMDSAAVAGMSSSTRSCGREASACLSTDKKDDMNGEINNAPALQRSRSVPASSSSSSVYENIGREPEDVNKSLSKDRAKGGKSSFKVKVSNFFLRNKRSAQDKHPGSQSSNGDSSGRSSPQLSSCNLNEGSVNTPMESPSLTPARSLNQDGLTFGPSAEASLIVKASEKAASESLAEPSPDSVLEAPFKDDASYGSSSCFYQGADLGSGRAISRSPPIESIARSLPAPCVNGARSEKPVVVPSPPPPRHSLTKFLKADSEEHERELFVKKLLSAAGMSEDDDETTTTATTCTTTVLARWHSLDSPLNPSLLDQFLERKGEEAQCRVRRSNQRLMFDGVNAALLDISWNRAIKGVLSWSAQWQRVVGPWAAGSVTKQVLGRLNEWFTWDGEGEEGWAWAPPSHENDTSLVVDRIVRREVGGGVWVEMGGMEVLELCKEMEEQVLQGLFAETLVDFISSSGQLQ